MGMNDVIVSIITTSITAICTLIVALAQVWMNSQRKKDKEEAKKLSEKNAAKSSIQNMITQDIIRTELLHKMPENMEAIENEFMVYSNNGGNGTLKRQYGEYLEWYKFQESKING
jgi:hypothetical protein